VHQRATAPRRIGRPDAAHSSSPRAITGPRARSRSAQDRPCIRNPAHSNASIKPGAQPEVGHRANGPRVLVWTGRRTSISLNSSSARLIKSSSLAPHLDSASQLFVVGLQDLDQIVARGTNGSGPLVAQTSPKAMCSGSGTDRQDAPECVSTSGIRRLASSSVVFVGAVYETEGHRFESCRARPPKPLLTRGFRTVRDWSRIVGRASIGHQFRARKGRE
jgi:hypothetical protein